KKLGRIFVGIDINKEYLAIAKTRLNSLERNTVPYDFAGAEKQLRIFDKPAKYKRLHKGKLAKAV
ncbi:MAG: hypothetical protein HZA00_10545, partial [Nitrospinae bacterium]|nr:hypothetical protein [Nitrospinota bacterium]